MGLDCRQNSKDKLKFKMSTGHSKYDPAEIKCFNLKTEL